MANVIPVEKAVNNLTMSEVLEGILPLFTKDAKVVLTKLETSHVLHAVMGHPAIKPSTQDNSHHGRSAMRCNE